MIILEIISSRIEGDILVVHARAWENGTQLGFGPDGSVDIEKFRFIKPKQIGGDWLDFQLKHTAYLSGKRGALIIPGKRGHTTDTYYPSSDAYIEVSNATWSTAHNASSGTAFGGTTSYIAARSGYVISRSFLNFDTSAIPDGGTILSATLSLYGDSKTGTGTRNYNIYSSTASDTVIGADYDLCGTTAYCDTSISHTNWNTAAYNNFAFNSTGMAAISKTGLSKFSAREANYDVANTPPADNLYVVFYSVEQTGTANDPKLVVSYSAMGGTATITGDGSAAVSRAVDIVGSLRRRNFTSISRGF